MAGITPIQPGQEDEAPQVPEKNIVEDGSSTNGEFKPAKPRARLGPIETVQLPASDSEPEDGDDRSEGDAEDPDENLLRDFPDDAEDIHLQHSRLKTPNLPPLNFPRFGRHLKRLCLRQNAITSPIPTEVFEGLKELEELDLYDNRLGPRIEDEEVAGCPNLTSLDFSFNNLRHPPTLPSQTRLKIFYLVQNKINHIDAGELDWCKDTLTSIELGGNRLRKIENIEGLTKLEELWLGKNKIRTLENLDAFANLKILSIQSNRLTKLENLEGLVSLEEIYLSHNGLKKIEGLEKNIKLKTLDVGNNMIEDIEGVSHLTQLEEFWANNNQIPNLRALDTQLAHITTLQTVYLEHNPCQTNDPGGYRRKVILALPQIIQVDATFVRAS